MKEYKIGEFSKLININKKTLIRWDKSGKLKPYKVLDNGYRFYSQKQLDEFLKNEKHQEQKDQEQKKSINQSTDQSEIIEILKQQNEFLKDQLKSKDELLKREQDLRLFADRKILMLEENLKDEKIRTENEQEETKKNWWKIW